MKKTVIKTIEIYQEIFSIFLKNLLGVPHFCRQRPTCSDYAKTQILKKGVIAGGYISLVRVLRCHPFAKPAYE